MIHPPKTPVKLDAKDHPMNRTLVIRDVGEVLDDKVCKFCLPDKLCALHSPKPEEKA